MENDIRQAFDRVHASEALKARTRDAVCRRTHHYGVRARLSGCHRMAAAVCMLVLLFGVGGWLSYTSPVAAISIDVNPSIEMVINRYDKVIGVEGYNDDGAELARELNVRNMTYGDAINQVLENDTVAACLKRNGLLEVTILSQNEERKENMQYAISRQTGIAQEHIYCMGRHEDVQDAHEAGVSFGKYRAYQELQELEPDVTVDDVRDLPMGEIRERIRCHGRGGGYTESGYGGGGCRNDYPKGHGCRR